MSDPHDEPQEEAPDLLGSAQPDWLLQGITLWANLGGLSLGVTLSTGGLLVSGVLVGGAEYFEGVAAELRGAGDNLAGFAEWIGSHGEVYAPSPSEPDAADSEEDTEPQELPAFIHLRDARFFHPSGKPVPTNRPVWWRGRIAAVEGFLLGQLSASDAD